MWWTRTGKPSTAKHRVPAAETAYVVRREVGEARFLTVAGADPYTTVRPPAMVAKTARYCRLCVR
jgi:hypothetical protein